MPKVLVVDDDMNATQTAEAILKTAGYEVVCLNNPKFIFKVIKAEQPDVIISDIIMPRWDGYALCREIKELYRNKIPVILCTAKSYEQELIEKAHKEFGADDFIFKPFKQETLLKKLEIIINKKKE
jgi:DNA-binding response OmpR family regulator